MALPWLTLFLISINRVLSLPCKMRITRSRAAQISAEADSPHASPQQEPTSEPPVPVSPQTSDNSHSDASTTSSRNVSPLSASSATSASSTPAPVVTKQTRNARQPNWKAWQDRFLIAETLELQPFKETRGAPIRQAWDRLASRMEHDSTKKGQAIVRTGPACRARFRLLMDAHQVSRLIGSLSTG